MTFATWQELYQSDLQSAVAVTIVPLLFPLYLAWTDRAGGGGVVPGAARFVRVWAGTFAVLTIVDPLAGGPLMRVLGLADTPTATAVMIAFVLLGDFRIYLLIFTLMSQTGARHDARVADPVLATRDAIRLVPPRAALRGGARHARRAARHGRDRRRAPRPHPGSSGAVDLARLRARLPGRGDPVSVRSWYRGGSRARRRVCAPTSAACSGTSSPTTRSGRRPTCSSSPASTSAGRSA